MAIGRRIQRAVPEPRGDREGERERGLIHKSTGMDTPRPRTPTPRYRRLFERGRGRLTINGIHCNLSLTPSNRPGPPHYHLQGEINYFTANQQRMLYPLYRSCGLPIGSGVVESACKNVVAKRMKQSGMSWSLDGAKEMLQLRASVMSRRFWDDYESLLPSSPTPESDQTQLKAA